MALIDESASGVYVIAATPFQDDGALDLDSADRMVDFYLERGADGLTVLGIMGEAPKLTEEEARAFAAARHSASGGRVRSIVGVSAPGLAAIRALAGSAMDVGAAGRHGRRRPAICAPTTRSSAISKASRRRSGRRLSSCRTTRSTTQVQIPPKVILRIVEALPTCVMLKHEDWPGLAKITALRAASARGARRISILTGNGGLFLPEELRARRRRRDDRLCLSRDDGRGGPRRIARAPPSVRATFSTPICRLPATSSNPGSALRRANTSSPSAARSPPPRCASRARRFRPRTSPTSSASSPGRRGGSWSSRLEAAWRRFSNLAERDDWLDLSRPRTSLQRDLLCPDADRNCPAQALRLAPVDTRTGRSSTRRARPPPACSSSCPVASSITQRDGLGHVTPIAEQGAGPFPRRSRPAVRPPRAGRRRGGGRGRDAC